MSHKLNGRDFILNSENSTTELREDYVLESDPTQGPSRYAGNFIVREDVAVGTVENTQAIQFFPSFHPEGAVVAGRGNNDIFLVAGKTTVLRVYLTTAIGLPSSTVKGVAYVRRFGVLNWGDPIAAYNGPIKV
ncbi:MAG: hypothetical protein ACRD88_09180, partial [Terriglobia bacterium]